MKKTQILDCTLRDGGYCNQWDFGEENINKIISKVTEAGIDIIECGFLTHNIEENRDISKYREIEEVNTYIQKRASIKYVLMANYGEYDFDMLPKQNGVIDGIRLAFHKENWKQAMKQCEIIKSKGYLVFVQPMVSLRYSEEEFMELISETNKLNPYAFYLVDSFGSMKKNDVKKLLETTDKTLNHGIKIGFHSHNNLQLAFSNAEWLLEAPMLHSLILDSSVYGMGRGAGNLNTELLAEHMNAEYGTNYKVEKLLEIIDEVLTDIYETNYWGYSLPNFLSATYNVHPNYAMYLENKKTITLKEMREIFERISGQKRYEYDLDYIKGIYLDYLDERMESDDTVNRLKQIFEGKDILLIASGKTSEIEKEKICEFYRKHNVISVSINFDYAYIEKNYIFVSNIRRFKKLNNCKTNIIATSNIKENVKYKVPYRKFLNTESGVEDNSAMILIQLLIECKANRIFLAGLDGYSGDNTDNYADEHMKIPLSNRSVAERNSGMNRLINDFAKKIDIEFVTTTKKIKLEKKTYEG